MITEIGLPMDGMNADGPDAGQDEIDTETDVSSTDWETSDSDTNDSDDEYTDDVVHLEQMISLLGKIPRRMAMQNRNFFNNRGDLRHPYTEGLQTQRGPVTESIVGFFNENRELKLESEDHVHMILSFCDMLTNMLWYSVHRRMSPLELLQHQLFQ